MNVRPAVPSGRDPAAADQRAAFALDVEYYLSLDPRQLPSRYLYDSLGSALFEAICQLPWYPIARAETQLLQAHRAAVMAAAGAPPARIVELGSGSGEKLLTLLEGRGATSRPLELHLIDVSPAALTASSRALTVLDDVTVTGHEAPYEIGLAAVRDLPDPGGRTLVLFLGSNIGNFDPPSAHEFVREIRGALRPDDLLLLGVDLVKPAAVVELAYDDPLGVTAAFNRNILVRINGELGGDFDINGFAHRAVWNAVESRVEMHLVSRSRQTVRIAAANLRLALDEGEAIWTESSYKYEPEDIGSLVERAGFRKSRQWIAEPDRFALTLFKAV